MRGNLANKLGQKTGRQKTGRQKKQDDKKTGRQKKQDDKKNRMTKNRTQIKRVVKNRNAKRQTTEQHKRQTANTPSLLKKAEKR